MKRLYMIILSVLGSIGIAIAISYAWFLNDTNVNPVAQGRSGAAYFAYGNGTTEPYGITTKRHLYNLAWLTYLFPEDYADKKYELAADIDCDGMVLPPIGKDNAPFTGYFDGNGYTITDLTTSNSLAHMTTKPNSIENNSTEVDNNILVNAKNIGFFGSIDANGSNNAKVHDFYLDSTTVKTATSQTCVGVVAGYVDGKIENVGVINSGLDLGASSHTVTHGTNVSDYTVVGYATDSYKTAVANRHTIVYNPNTSYTHFNYIGMGNGDAFGGSIDMQKLYNRVLSANPKTPTVSSYITDELVYEGFEDVKTKQTITSSHSTRAYNSFNDARGTYLKNTDVEDRYQAVTSLYKNIHVVRKTTTTENGYKLQSNGQFLSFISSENPLNNTFNFTTSIGYNDDEDSATIWIEEGNSSDKKLYTYSEYDGYKYYLVANSDYTVTISSTTSSLWYWDSTNDAYYTKIGNGDYYLKHYGSAWTIKPLYTISDGNGHYLSYNGGITNLNEDSATAWFFENDGATPSGKIYDGSGHYLRNNNGTFTTSDLANATSWSNDGFGIYDSGYYIQYNSGWVISRPLDFYITYNDGDENNYLTFDYNNGNPRFINQTDKENSNTWHFSANNGYPNGTISYVYDNGLSQTTYYLRNNNGTLEVSTSQTSWLNSGDGLNYNNYYLQFDKSQANKWKISTARSYYITYYDGQVTHYLSATGTTLSDQTDESNATLWTFSNSGNNPSGTISYVYNNTTYYLRFNNILQVSTASTTWSNNGSGIYNNGSYIQLINGMWVCGKAYYISDGSGKYLSVNNGTSLVSSSVVNTLWIFSSNNGTYPQGRIYTVYGNKIKYLYYNNASLTLNENSYTTWNNNGTSIYNGTYIIHLEDWVSSGFRIAYSSSYLIVSGTTDTAVGTSFADATIWYVNNKNVVYTIISNTIYYLYANSSDYAKISTSESPGGYGLAIKKDKAVYEASYDSYYLKISSNSWRFRSGSTNLDWLPNYKCVITSNTVFEQINIKSISNMLTLDINLNVILKEIPFFREKTSLHKIERLEPYETPSLFTCIPINASSSNPYSVEENNTGYIISGGHEPSETNADIRISQFTQTPQIGSGIAGSFTNSTHTWIENKIYTIGSNGLGVIADNSSASGLSYDKSIYENYSSSRSTLQTTLTNSGDYVYGLHFMDSKISKSKMVTAEYAYINDDSGNKNKTNYQMPEDCIDFNLKSKGYITVYSGYYFKGTGGTNNAFFSLNEVIRNSNDEITQIRHILNVYKRVEDNVFIYRYEDCDDSTIKGYYYFDVDANQYVDVQEATLFTGNTLKSGYELKFDYNWVEHPVQYGGSYNTTESFYNQYQTNVFYFEIPVNKGEYAIGSVEGGVGTYLMYLDIGANASYVDRTEISQVTQNVTYSFEYVNGIQVLQSNSEVAINSISAQNSVSVVIKTSVTGTIVLNKTDSSTINIESNTGVSRNLNASYQGDNITTFNGDLSEVPRTIVTKKVLKFIDYNNGDGKLYRTTITKIGSNTATSVVHQIDKSDIATNLNLYDESVNVVPDSTKYGLLRRGTSSDPGNKEGYGVEDTAENLMSLATFKAIPADNSNNYYDSSTSDNTNKLLEYYCRVNPASSNNLSSFDEDLLMKVAEISDERKINSISISSGTNKLRESDGYNLLHVYRMTGVDATITSSQLSSIVYNNKVRVLIYDPTIVEESGDTNPNYVFTINGITVNTVSQEVAVVVTP